MSEATLEDTPTWIVASVCSVIVLISFVFERALHHLGKALERRRKTLYEALLKLKEELMLLGFVSLLLVVFQELIQKICIDESLMEHWLPCRGAPAATSASATAHHGVSSSAVINGGRRMLKGGGAAFGHCSSEGKVPLLSLHALEQVHIFIFVLAITQVVLSVATVLLGLLQMRIWMHWENTIQEEGSSAPKMIARVQKIRFVQDRCKGYEKATWVIIWLRSFFKQFYGSVSNDDYIAMRLGFVMEHFRGHPKFNFYDYMIKALEKDFKRVVSIKWYYWIFVMIFLLVNVTGWHSYFWISLVPLALLLLIGTKLEHIINKLAYEVASKHAAGQGEGGIVVSPSDELFWFHSPRLVLVLIHFILFQNAFEFAYFFWTLVGDVRRQLLHHGQSRIQRIANHHMRRRPGALQLQHAPALRHCVPYGEFVQERCVRGRRRRASQRLGRWRSEARAKICHGCRRQLPWYAGGGTGLGRRRRLEIIDGREEPPNPAASEHLLLSSGF
ncbi:MLO-like protein 1 isoform X1 [Miscanthus floridulus]|uniref:MLO-like protein 1 isoform X1 n=1 Tax=Miscanthus floridulus TaxID=154761 RepID=UPI003458A08B